MIDINRSLGIEELFADKERVELLKECLMERPRFVSPGYGTDYYLRTFNNAVDIALCKELDGSDRGFSVHFSGNQKITFILDQIISTEGCTHLFQMHKGNSDTFPVRIVSPDVLAAPAPGDSVFGQVEAFAGDEVAIKEVDSDEEGFIQDQGNGNVLIAGWISGIDELSFEFEGIFAEYYELVLDTNIGPIPVVLLKKKLQTPELGQYLRTDAVLSLDLAIAPDPMSEASFARTYYANAPFREERRLGAGFTPNRANAEKVLVRCAEDGDFLRFRRACTETITVHQMGKETSESGNAIDAVLLSFAPALPDEVKIMHLLSCAFPELRGWNAVVLCAKGELAAAFVIKVDSAGFVDELWMLDLSSCELGYDSELHALSMFSYGMYNNAEFARECLSEKCYYHSEYADKTFVGAERIIEHLKIINNNLNESNRYSSCIKPSAEILRTQEDLPEIYKGKWCDVQHQGNALAYVVFIQQDEAGRICNIRLSRNGNYCKLFEKEGSSEPITGVVPPNVKILLEDFYGHEDPLKAMRENDTPEEDERGIYVWKGADHYMCSWLGEQGYTVTETVAEDDCLGYACRQKGMDYAIYVYAYGKQPIVSLKPAYCQRLKNYPLSENRMILVVYLRVETVLNDKGEETYRVGLYHNTLEEPDTWRLEEVNGKEIFLYYSPYNLYKMCYRLMAAYNTQNLDLLRAICTSDVYLESISGGRTLNDGFYSNLAHLFEKHGKMKSAYVRINEEMYYFSSYIEDYCYFTFSVKRASGKICEITEHPIDESKCGLLLTDECVDSYYLNNYPLLKKAEFLPPSDHSRFSARLMFENGEIRRYDFPVENQKAEESEEKTAEETSSEETTSAEKVKIGSIWFTDKIFQHGMIQDHIALPEWMGYRNYPQRGQGIAFFNGYAISTAELYFNSYPIERFDYSKMDQVFISQFDYSDDGYAVGRISDLDPQNPLYLFDKNTYTATTLPEKYQNTQIGFVPFYGGYSEGRVMVSLLGDISLQYHHNRMGCAGMWGWLDKKLNEVIPPQYIFAMNFEGGHAIVCKGKWDINEDNEYWCDDERWGVIDLDGNEVVPCRFDELYEIGGTNRLYFIHEGGYENGYFGVFDVKEQAVILELDFDFDMGYMFNECFVTDNDILVFDEHLPGEGKDLISAYDLRAKKFLLHQEENTERTFQGEKTMTVTNEQTGMEILVF